MESLIPRLAALEAENAKLRRLLADAVASASQAASDAHAAVLAESRQQTSDAREGTRQATEKASRAAAEHESEIAIHHADAARQQELYTALQTSEGRLRLILESARDFAIFATDPDGRVTEWNIGAERILGWKDAEILGQDVRAIWTPEDRQAGVPEEEMRTAREKGRATDERWHLRRDGSRFWVSGELMPMRDQAGRLVGYLKILRDRTEHHRAGQALEAVNERFRLAQRATRDAIWDWNLADNSVMWNAALEEAYGWTPAQVEPTGDWWIAQIHPDDRDRIDRNIHAVIEGAGTSWTEEYRFRRSDGSYAEVLDRGSVIRGPDGRAARMIGAMLDMTHMRTAEAAVRTSQARFQTILDTIEAAFAIVQVKFDAEDRPVDYRFVEVNPAFEQQAGVNLRGKWVTEFAPDLEPFWFETYGRVAKTGEPATFESYAEAFERWFDVRALRVGDPADRQIAIFFTDSTARRVAEEQLRASEAALQLANMNLEERVLERTEELNRLWASSPDLLVVIDFNGFFRRINPAWTTLLGYEPDELLGQHVNDFVVPDDAAKTTEAYESAARGEALRVENSYRHKDGSTRRISWVATPVGELIYATGRDVTRERAAADELARTQDALRQSQKMEAVGQLTGGLAHDFNNLLTGVTGNLELLQARIAQGRIRDLDRYVNAAQGAAKRASALTHRLLAFSRRQTLDPKPTDVNRLVNGMEELIRRTVGPEITVEAPVSAAGLWPTLVDPGQLENALLNLCINARDAMPGGGKITIETANRWMDHRIARERDLEPGQYISLCVSDTGTGMTPEVIAKAFDPFFTTKPIGQGTGLGLSMIYGFAKQSGGQARIYSEVGQGATVCLYLPRHLGEADAAEPVPEPAVAPRAEAGETVLVVDDEPTVRMLVTEVLEDLGYRAIEAADGASGLQVLQSDARIDLLVTDVGLPGGLNGRQVADAGRVVRPDLKVLFITGYAENAVLSHGHLAPGMHVLTKPFAMEVLASRIKELIAA